MSQTNHRMAVQEPIPIQPLTSTNRPPWHQKRSSFHFLRKPFFFRAFLHHWECLVTLRITAGTSVLIISKICTFPSMNQLQEPVAPLWCDESLSSINKCKWIMTTDSGAAFTAVIAIVLTLTASRSWKILKYTMYMSRQHNVPRSAMIREQEVHLRVAETDLGTFWNMISVLHTWKHFGRLLPINVRTQLIQSSRRSTRRILIIAFIHFMAWAYLAVQVPEYLLSRNPLVLLHSGRCAVWDFDAMDPNVQLQSAISTVTSYGASAALQYYENCYYERALSNPSECSYLAKPTLPWAESLSECPFDSVVCLGSGNNSITLETGELSPDYFGLNSPVQSAITVEKRMTCAPLNWTYFYVHIPGENWVAFNFTNGTFKPGFEDYFPIFYPGRPTGYYVSKSHRPGWDGLQSDHSAKGPKGRRLPQLSPLLQRTDGDVSVFVIQKDGVFFAEPVEDPVFAALQKHPNLIAEMQYYDAEEPFGLLGCVEQIQMHDKRRQARSLWQSPGLENIIWAAMFEMQKDMSDTVQFLAHILRHSTLSFFPSAWDASRLLQAQESSTERNVQLALQSDHWKTEVRRWFLLSLAKAQLVSNEVALGQTYGANTTGMHNLLADPIRAETRHFFCRSSKVHSSAHVSVGVSALLLFITLTSLIWVLSSCDGLIGRMVFKKRPHAVLAWYLDHPAQLLKQLYSLLHITANNQDDLDSTFGTLGVPVLTRLNGSELQPQYRLGSTEQSHQLYELVKDLSRQDTLNIIGVGFEDHIVAFYSVVTSTLCLHYRSFQQRLYQYRTSLAIMLRGLRINEGEEQYIPLSQDIPTSQRETVSQR